MPLFNKHSSSAPTPPDHSSRPPPKGITCAHCHETGLHYSDDCPLSCDYCGQKGHVEKDCAPRCFACYGRGEIRKTKSDDEEDRRPGVRALKALLEAVVDARKELQGDFNERYRAAVKQENERMSDPNKDATPADRALTDKIKQRRSKLWEFDTAMDNVECWTRWSNSVLETLAKMDNEE